jgi:hypothetical protein
MRLFPPISHDAASNRVVEDIHVFFLKILEPVRGQTSKSMVIEKLHLQSRFRFTVRGCSVVFSVVTAMLGPSEM